jgi:predicted transcriptional regulator
MVNVGQEPSEHRQTVLNISVKDVMTRNVVAVRETAGYKNIVTAMRRPG